MLTDSVLGHYLSRHAEPEAQMLSTLPAAHWQRAVVIPAYNETADFLTRSGPLFEREQAILVLVLNRPDSVADCSANDHLLQSLPGLYGRPAWQHAHLSLYHRSGMSLLLVDRHTQPIPVRQGVGLARKIGCDIVCGLIAIQRVTQPWIYSTDADAQLPAPYFTPPVATTTASAWVFNFRHVSLPECPASDDCLAATEHYDQHLRYYRRGLAYANSPYAFFTLGSTLAVSATHYCQARGFPRRAGAEDFYLLNKLAKLAPVINRDDITLTLAARESDRVPFGTGPAVKKIIALQAAGQPVTTYHPHIFFHLKQWLASAPLLWPQIQAGADPWQIVPPKAAPIMRRLKLEKLLTHVTKQCHNQQSFERAFNQWFDAFLTLKFIHAMQDTLPPQNQANAILALNELINATD